MKLPIALLLMLSPAVLAQGPLTPPTVPGHPVGPIPPVDGNGDPQPTMKTLHQIEPGIDVNAAGLTTITSPGRYILSADIGAITIDASRVTLDLRGFTATDRITVSPDQSNIVIRNGFCTGSLSAYQVGSERATNGVIEDLQMSSTTVFQALRLGHGWTLRRCHIEGYTGSAVSAGDYCVFENCSIIGLPDNPGVSNWAFTSGEECIYRNCIVRDYHGNGIRTSSRSLIEGCIISDTNQNGVFFLGSANLITDTIITGNTSWGLQTVSGTISNCTINSNRDGGIRSTGGTLVDSCDISSNVGPGVEALGRIRLVDCTISRQIGTGVIAQENCFASGCLINDNGVSGVSDGGLIAGDSTTVIDCTANDNNGPGISVGDDSSVSGSTANNNASHGIRAEGVDVTLDNNTASGNTGHGISLLSNANVVTRNTVRGNTTGAIDLSGGSVAPIASPATATNPFSNLQ